MCVYKAKADDFRVLDQVNQQQQQQQWQKVRATRTESYAQRRKQLSVHFDANFENRRQAQTVLQLILCLIEIKFYLGFTFTCSIVIEFIK